MAVKEYYVCTSDRFASSEVLHIPIYIYSIYMYIIVVRVLAGQRSEKFMALSGRNPGLAMGALGSSEGVASVHAARMPADTAQSTVMD